MTRSRVGSKLPLNLADSLRLGQTPLPAIPGWLSPLLPPNGSPVGALDIGQGV